MHRSKNELKRYTKQLKITQHIGLIEPNRLARDMTYEERRELIVILYRIGAAHYSQSFLPGPLSDRNIVRNPIPKNGLYQQDT